MARGDADDPDERHRGKRVIRVPDAAVLPSVDSRPPVKREG